MAASWGGVGAGTTWALSPTQATLPEFFQPGVLSGHVSAAEQAHTGVPNCPTALREGGAIQAQRWNIPREEHSWGGRKEASAPRSDQTPGVWAGVGGPWAYLSVWHQKVRGCPHLWGGVSFWAPQAQGSFWSPLCLQPLAFPLELWVADSSPAGLHQLLAETKGAALACLGDTWL